MRGVKMNVFLKNYDISTVTLSKVENNTIGCKKTLYMLNT